MIPLFASMILLLTTLTMTLSRRIGQTMVGLGSNGPRVSF